MCCHKAENVAVCSELMKSWLFWRQVVFDWTATILHLKVHFLCRWMTPAMCALIGFNMKLTNTVTHHVL